jgi:hypothetical protein
MTRWLRMLARELPLLRHLPGPDDRALPRVAIETGPTVPGWLLRAVLVLVAAGIAAIVAWRVGMPAGLAWVTIAVAAAATATLPASVHAVVVAAGVLVAAAGHGPFDPVVFPLLPLAYAGVRLAWWAERVAPGARVEAAALARGVPRAVALVGGTAGFGALVLLLAGQPSALVVVGGGAALVALTWLLRRRLA